MKAVWTTETLVNLHESTWHYSLEDGHLHTYCCENLESYYSYDVYSMHLVVIGPQYFQSHKLSAANVYLLHFLRQFSLIIQK
jgi:hypothetical protein